AFVRTAALELRGVRCLTVDLDPAAPASVQSARLFDELLASGEETEVGYVGDRRITLAPRHVPLAVAGAAAAIVDRDSVVLITGGARGISAQLAIRLAERRPTLILAGLSSLPAEEAPVTGRVLDPAALKDAIRIELQRERGTVRPSDVETAWR